MKITILVSALLIALSPGDVSDLCEVGLVDVDGSPIVDERGQNLPVYCQWTGPDVPVWDGLVCCDLDGSGAACTAASSSGRCEIGEPYYCAYGEQTATGEVQCYEPFPDMCDAGHCVAPPAGTPPVTATMDTDIACCSPGGACVLVTYDNVLDCQGEFLGCYWGVTNDDGTVDCYDYW